jgi:Ras-related protein Rab-8A
MSRGKQPKYDHLLKLLLIGDSGVGKSNILLRYSDDSFTSSFITTIGIDFKIKNMTIADSKVKLQIWDTAGQERFRTITTAYYRGAMGILVVYDVTNEETFENVHNWLRQIDQNAGPNVVRVLVGNKCDSEDERQVSTQRGQELAAKFGIDFFETSAKLNVNISEVFGSISTDIVQRIKKNPELFSADSSKSRNPASRNVNVKREVNVSIERKCC